MNKDLYRGFTILEALIALAIIAITAALLTPVFLAAKNRSRVNVAASNLRQLHMAVEIYRSNWDGGGNFGTLAQMGLPTFEHWTNTYLGLGRNVVHSPCGFDQTIFETGPGGSIAGDVFYAPPWYDPARVAGSGSNLEHYLMEYRDNAVLFCDPYCNPKGTRFTAQFLSKRGLAVLLSGQLINRFRSGNGAVLTWWSDPPDS